MAKKSTKNLKSTVRIGPRISRGVYQLAKYVYGIKEVNFEDQIEELLERDLDYQMKQKWFLNAISGKESERFEKLKNTVRTDKGPMPSDGSDFDSNNVSGDEGYEPI